MVIADNRLGIPLGLDAGCLAGIQRAEEEAAGAGPLLVGTDPRLPQPMAHATSQGGARPISGVGTRSTLKRPTSRGHRP